MQVPCCKLLILGDSGTGKTSLLRLLTGKSFRPEHILTEGIDTSLVQTRTIGCVDQQTLVTLREDGQFSQFNNLAGAEICERMKKVNCYSIWPDHLPIKAFKSEDEMLSELNKLRQLQVEPNCNDTNVKAMVAISKKSTLLQSEERQMETENPTQHTQKELSPRSSAKKHLPPSEVFGSRRLSENVVERLNDHSRTEPELRLVAWDFAGQPLYHPMHHCFITYRAMYIVTFKLNEFVERMKKESVCRQIAFWLNTIQAHVRYDEEASDSSIPPIFLVGTFRDTPSKNGIKIDHQKLKSISCELRRRFFDSKEENRWLKHIQFYGSDNEQMIFAAIENSDVRKTSGAEMLQREMLRTLKKLRFMKEERPLKWLKFEEIIFAMRKDGKKSTLAERAKLREETRELKFSDAEFDLLLQFFHDLGTIVNPSKLPLL